MDYEEVVAAMMGARPDGVELPTVVAHPTPARRLRDVTEPLAMHAVWCRATNERLAALGLDFVASYIYGRGAGMGDPAPAVVASAFAWFEPGMVTGVYGQAREHLGREVMLEARASATTESLRGILDGEDPTSVADRLADVMEDADGTGRPIFSGLRAQGRPVDPVQRLWWACDLVREHRGDTHVAVAIAAGVDPVEMNVLTELWLGFPLYSHSSTRGWSMEQLEAAFAGLARRGWIEEGSLTDEGIMARTRIEAQTDAGETAILDALGSEFDGICSQLNAWSDRCIDALAFPADLLKRAAG